VKSSGAESMPPIPLRLSEKLPFPIAFHVHLCRTREANRSPESGVRYLFRAVEGLVRYLSLLVVSDYLQKKAFNPTTNALLWRKACREKLGLGTWMELLREVTRAFAEAHRETSPPGIVPLLFLEGSGKWKPSGVQERLNDLITARNVEAHVRAFDPRTQLVSLSNAFSEVLQEVQFLADYPLIVPTEEAKGARTITAFTECMGPTRDFVFHTNQRVEVPRELADMLTVTGAPALLTPDRRKVLTVLYPLQLFEEGLRDDCDLYDYYESVWGSNAPARVSFESHKGVGDKGFLHVGPQLPNRSFVIDDFARRLAPLVPAATPPVVAPIRTYCINSAEVEIDAHCERFVGRTQEREELLTTFARLGKGYVCYEGPTGTGKSAFAAHLIRRFHWAGHLIKKESRRDDPARFLPCLLHQLMERNCLLRGIGSEPGEQEEQLYQVFQEVGAAPDGRPHPAAVVVLDGLHLLPQDVVPGFLFETLPPGAFFVLFSQRCLLLETLRASRAPWVDLSIVGLTDPESRDFLDRYQTGLSDADKDEIIQEANGFPLYLTRAAQAAQVGQPWRGATATTLEAGYRQVVTHAVQANGASAEAVLGLLCVAREPLSVVEFAEIARLSARQVRGILERVEPYLLCVNSQYTIFHESFREFLRRELAAAVARADEEIIRWSRQALA
jgi:hypothetical protein